MGKSYEQFRSRLQEERAARDIGGRPQPGSGSLAQYKGDARTPWKMRCECKFTRTTTFTLTLEMLRKIQKEAAECLEQWFLQIEFAGQVGFGSKLAVLDPGIVMEMREEGRLPELHFVNKVIEAKSVRISLPELLKDRAEAREQKKALVWRLIFRKKQEPRVSPDIIYYLMDYDLYHSGKGEQ